jgi:hypothetical protein
MGGRGTQEDGFGENNDSKLPHSRLTRFVAAKINLASRTKMQMWGCLAVVHGERNVKLSYLSITPMVELLAPLGSAVRSGGPVTQGVRA